MKHIKFYLLSTWINILIKFKRGGVGICFLHMQKIILKWKFSNFILQSYNFSNLKCMWRD